MKELYCMLKMYNNVLIRKKKKKKRYWCNYTYIIYNYKKNNTDVHSKIKN